MVRNIVEINKQLREYQEKWFIKTCQPWIEKARTNTRMASWVRKHYKTTDFSFSQPFFTGLPNYTDPAKPLIMFVGQETNGWGNIEDFDINGNKQWNIHNSQESTIDILTKNLNLRVNSSVFWKFIVELYQKTGLSFNICWNNLDKIHYTVKVNNRKGEERDECITLYKDDEEQLNGIVDNQKTLLQLEIDTIKPDLVVFLTGPYYLFSMESALSNLRMDNKPTISNPLVVLQKGIIWTYHPSFLSRHKEKKESVINGIVERIKK